MKAVIKRFHSPDIHDLENYIPKEKDDFGFLFQLIVGIKGVDSEESFDMIICTPRWIERRYSNEGMVFGGNFLIVFEYDLKKIKQKISDYVEKLDETNWNTLAKKIDRIGKWEFRDYYEIENPDA